MTRVGHALLPGADQLYGRVYAVMRFAFVEGDGAYTWRAHPRSPATPMSGGDVLQAVRCSGRNEVVAAVIAACVWRRRANYAQGTEFRDGSSLITTPGRSRAIDDIAARFAGGLDFGRFDIRQADDQGFAARGSR
ncbi:MAG: hypothetical protein R3B49_07795 [Phycisphaerales bacterium]